jgi:C4-dicarboxylate transporter DctM subunit
MTEVGIILLAAFGTFLFGGVPIVFALGVAAAIGLWVSDIDLVVVVQRTVSGTQSFSLLAVPGFILAGELMFRGGLSRRLIRMCNSMVARFRGGLGMVLVLSATFFAAISGSAPATTAAIGKIMIPEMEKRGYERSFATALATASGPIGQMIPPSIPMIVWGVISETSITRLFLAGVIPGLLVACGLMFLCFLTDLHAHRKSETRTINYAEVRAAFKDGLWALMAPVIILGGIYGGIFTPTEASAIGVVYGLVVGIFVYKEITWVDLPEVVLVSMKTTTVVIFVIATAGIFGWLVTLEDLPNAIAEGVFGISDDPIVILLMINALLLFIGAIMDNIAAMLILGAFLISLGQQLGLDPTHLGAIVVINFAVGMATPPFGYSLFVGAAISGLSVEKISMSLWPMLLVQIVVLALLTFIPPITLFLPDLFL